jgi:hypothetical protein
MAMARTPIAADACGMDEDSLDAFLRFPLAHLIHFRSTWLRLQGDAVKPGIAHQYVGSITYETDPPRCAAKLSMLRRLCGSQLRNQKCCKSAKSPPVAGRLCVKFKWGNFSNRVIAVRLTKRWPHLVDGCLLHRGGCVRRIELGQTALLMIDAPNGRLRQFRFLGHAESISR